MGPEVQVRHFQFVQQASTMAVATVDGLAKGAVRVGRTIHMGEFATGIEELLVFQQRLGRFLNYVVLAEMALEERDPALATRMGDFSEAILGSLEVVTMHLDTEDWGPLGIALARSMATHLLEYRHFGDQVVVALAQMPTAAQPPVNLVAA